jgi:hypothetical protein
MFFHFSSHSPTFRRAVFASVLAAAALVASGAPVFASNVTVDAEISETGSWDSNPLMLAHNAEPLFGSSTVPHLVFTDETPTSRLNADVSVGENIFNQSTFDSTDFHGNFGLSHRIERWEASLKEKTDYDTTRTSELTTFGENAGSIRHLGLLIAPGLAFKPTSLDKLTVDGSASASRYDGPSFTDYDVFTLTPSWMHNFTPLHAGLLSFRAQRYQTESGPGLTVDSAAPMLGWAASFTPRWSGKFTVGLQASQQSGAGVADESLQWNYVYSADLSYKGEQDFMNFIATRAQQPYGNGTELLLTTFSIKEDHALNPKLSMTALLSYQYSQSTAESGSNLKSLLKANPGLAYHVTDNLDILTAYQYKYESLTGADEVAKGSSVTLGLKYRPWGKSESQKSEIRPSR